MKITFGEKRPGAGVRIIDPHEVEHGPGWIVLGCNDQLELRYQTGGHGTAEGSVAIDRDELRLLQDDPAALDVILRKHGV